MGTVIRKALLPAALALLCARLAWEYFSPLSPGDFKGLIYLRDAAFLFPASILMVLFVFTSRQGPLLDAAVSRAAAFLPSLDRNWKLAASALACFAAAECVAINTFVLRGVAHTVDEVMYLFQAKVLAAGRLWASPSVLPPELFASPVFVQTADKWYSSFFPGQSIALAAGVLAGSPQLVNPLLTGCLVYLTVWGGKRLFSLRTGLLAGSLMLFSPFLLFQGASYFSHTGTALCLTLSFLWFVDEEKAGSWKALGAGLLLGAALLFRPLSAFLAGLFFLLFVAVQCGRKCMEAREGLEKLVLIGAGLLPGALLFFAHNGILTGNPLLTPHQIALPGEEIAFGVHSLTNTAINLVGLSIDLLGVPLLSLVPFVFFVTRKEKWSMVILLFGVLYVAGYAVYPYHGLSYGPRFYFELLPLLMVGSSRGLLAGVEAMERMGREGRAVFVMLLSAAVVVSLFGVFPGRAAVFTERGKYYDIRPAVDEIVPPALVFIANPDRMRIYPYMAGFQLNSADFGGPVVFVRDPGSGNLPPKDSYHGRNLYRLDVDTREVIPYPHREGL